VASNMAEKGLDLNLLFFVEDFQSADHDKHQEAKQ
jgi:hypothetical protein